MARKSKSAKQAELMTLTEVHRRTGISMPTLQKYKKKHADRIPSEGEGRRQRYPEEALAVFEQIKEENVARRGRPKAASGKKKATKAKTTKGKGTKRRSSKKKRATKAAEASSADTAASGEPELLSLTEIARRTGISQPTLTRYARQNPDIPHEIQGKRKVYPAEAIPIFVEMREAKKRTPKKSKPKAKRKTRAKAKPKAKARSRRRSRAAKKKAAPEANLESIASTLVDLESRLAQIEAQLAQPIVVEVRR